MNIYSTRRVATWPLHDIGMINMVWFIAYMGGRKGSLLLSNNRALVLQQGGQCRWAWGMKGWLIRAQQPRRKRIYCKGQVTRCPAPGGESEAGRPLQDIVLLRGLCARINHPFIANPPALPTRLQCDCNSIAQYSTPSDPPFLCHIPYNIVQSNIV